MQDFHDLAGQCKLPIFGVFKFEKNYITGGGRDIPPPDITPNSTYRRYFAWHKIFLTVPGRVDIPPPVAS